MSGRPKLHCGDVEQPDFDDDVETSEHAMRTQQVDMTPRNPTGAVLGVTNHLHVAKLSVESNAFCRVCWDERGPKSDPLVSPCSCAGSQAYIHLSCLRAWQRAVLENSVAMGDERAYRCGVCKTLYSFSPDVQRAKFRNACLRVFRLALVVGCLFSLYCGIHNIYMWPLLGFVGLILPTLASSRGGGVRAAHVVLCGSILVLVLVLRFLVPYPDIKSFFTTMTEASEEYIDEGVYGHGPSQSLYARDIRPGALLLSNHDVIGHGSSFSHSVVLLFSHSATNGTQGVILNQRILSPAESLESGCFSSSSDFITECMHAQRRNPPKEEDIGGPLHYFGGPTFALERLVVMHMFGNIPGSRKIVLGGDDEGREVGEEDQGYTENIYFGGLISDVLAQQRQPGSERKPIWIFHGISSWSQGQLMDEIDAGAWTVKSSTLDDIVFFSQNGIFDVT